jgi:hypothetical protein
VILEELADLEKLLESFQGTLKSSQQMRQRIADQMAALQEELKTIESASEVVSPTQDSGSHAGEATEVHEVPDRTADVPEEQASYDRAQTMIDSVSPKREFRSPDRAQEMIDYLNAKQPPISKEQQIETDLYRVEEPRKEERSVELESAQSEKPTASPKAPVAEEVPLSREDEERKPQVDTWVEHYLGTQFNITPEDIKSIEGFDRLSVGQQKFICENLAQLTLGNVQEEAAGLVSKSVGMRRSQMMENYGRVLGGVLAGAREVLTRGHTKLQAQKEVDARMRGGGMQEHGALLAELVRNMSEKGPRIHDDGRGGLIVDLLNIRDRATEKSLRNEEWFAMNELNAAAHELAQTPAAWGEQTLGVDMGLKWDITRFFKEKVGRTKGAVQESAYTKRVEIYEHAKRNLEEILHKKGDSDLKIAQILIGLDSRVYELQTLQTNPNAMEELAAIKDKDFVTESVKQFFKGPGAYMAIGALGRTLAGATVGFFGAPIVAGALGSVRSWNRTAAELRERDRNARAGVRDTKSGALNVVAAERAEQIVMVNGQPMQNGLTAKLARLLSEAQAAEGDKKERLLAQLRTRVEYVHDKERLRRIDYGTATGRVSRHAALTETLAQALVYLAEEELAASAEVKQRTEKTRDRLARTLSRAEQAIIAARLKGRKSDLVRSAGIAASFSLAGALIADYLHTDPVSRGGEGAAVPDTGSAEMAEAASKTLQAPYTIKHGDTLWDILSQKTSLAELGETRARENAVANIVKSLTPAELQEIGVTSGDARLIYPGDTINMEKLSGLLNEHRTIIENARVRYGHLPIDTDLADIIPSQPEK